MANKKTEEELSLQGAGEAGGDEALSAADLSSTVGAFSTRIQRKRKEQKRAGDLAEQQARVRQHLMLEAMSHIRRSLSEVSRIELGERFYFSLVGDDWQGWPRLTIVLCDSKDLQAEFQNFEVTANDRNSRGTIEVVFDSREKTEKIVVEEKSDLKNLPFILKKCARHYLDLVGEIVLNSHKSSTEDLEPLKQEAPTEGEHRSEEDVDSGLSDDLFVDDMEGEALSDSLPSLDSVSALPDLNLD